MTDTPDTTTMTGAEFQRWAGTDAAKWAEAFFNSAAAGGECKNSAERIAFIARWFRDYAEVKVAEALRGETDSACPPTS